MSAFKSLRELIQALNPEEVEVARNYLKAFPLGGNTRDVKTLKLLDTLAARQNQDLSERDIMYLCYGTLKQGALDRLVLRLRDKLIESLVLDINVERQGAYSDRWRIMTRIRKQINVAQILTGRGLIKHSLYLLQAAIEDAKTYEFYDELLIALRLQIQDSTIIKGEKEFNRIYDLIKQYTVHRDAVERAYLIYAEYPIKNHFRSGIAESSDWTNKNIALMERDYKITGSATVGYLLHIIKYSIYSQRGDIKHSKENMLELVSLLNKSKAIYTPARMGINFARLGEVELQLENFDQAIGFAYKGFDILKMKEVDQLSCLEIIGLATFYQQDYSSAKDILSQCVRRGEIIGDSEFRIGRRMLILAWIYFMEKEFKLCLSLVKQINPIEKDSEGWNIGLRILTIMVLIELYQEEKADQTILALKQHIIKLRKETSVNPRATKILNLFITLEKNGFQFKGFYPRVEETLKRLGQKTGELKWMPYTFELMPFQRWLISKIFKTPFSLEKKKTKKEPKEIKMILHLIAGENE